MSWMKHQTIHGSHGYINRKTVEAVFVSCFLSYFEVPVSHVLCFPALPVPVIVCPVPDCFLLSVSLVCLDCFIPFTCHSCLVSVLCRTPVFPPIYCVWSSLVSCLIVGSLRVRSHQTRLSRTRRPQNHWFPMVRRARFFCVFQARLKVKIFSTLSPRRGGAQLINVTLGQCSQSNQAGGELSFRFSRREPHISGI